MAGQFDSIIISFTTKTDKVDLVQAAHINLVQSELVLIENRLGVGFTGDRVNLASRLSNSMDADGTIRSGSSFPSPAFFSMPFWRTDLDTLYVYGTSGWLQQGGSVGNVLFEYHGSVDAGAAASAGEVTGTSLNPAGVTGNYRFLQKKGTQNSYSTIWTTKWTKISGVSTIVIYTRLWVKQSGSNANVKVDVGGQNNNVSGTASQTTPEWKSFTIPVTALTNGVTYDITVSMTDTAAANQEVYCSDVVGMGT